MLTDSPAPFVRGILHRENLNQLFEAIVVSSEIRSTKPHQLAYKSILDALGAAADTSLMIDDNPINVEAAKTFGMNGVVFDTLGNLRRLIAVE